MMEFIDTEPTYVLYRQMLEMSQRESLEKLREEASKIIPYERIVELCAEELKRIIEKAKRELAEVTKNAPQREA